MTYDILLAYHIKKRYNLTPPRSPKPPPAVPLYWLQLEDRCSQRLPSLPEDETKPSHSDIYGNPKFGEIVMKIRL